jgi:hypothetical protein
MPVCWGEAQSIKIDPVAVLADVALSSGFA